MSRKLASFALLFAFSVAVGCGDSQPTTTANNGTSPTDPAAAVVEKFLSAVRVGDTDTASSQLTQLALERTQAMDLNFSPPGSDTATFKVGAVEHIDADKALVESMWSDVDADGQQNVENITWALRLANGEWRISGMAADLGPNQAPVVMDFENPGQMMQPPTTQPPTVGQPQQPATRQASQPAADPFQQPVTR